MVANFSRVNASTDVHELILLLKHVGEAARSFAELADRFRLAPSRSRTPSILKRDVNGVFALQAGELLCQCWRRGMFSVYRPQFYFPEEDEPRIRYVFSWFTFIRWHLAPIFKNRFRADWQSEFAPEMDQIKGQRDYPSPDFKSAVSDNAEEVAVWRLDLHANVQETACIILAEELEQLLEAVQQRLEQLPVDKGGIAAAAIRMLNVYTNGLADERLDKASKVLDSDLTVDEKLWKIDELMPIPLISAAKLGKLFTSKEKPEGVSKTAIQATSWYKQKRKGRTDEEIDKRENRLRQQGKTYERDRQPDDDD